MTFQKLAEVFGNIPTIRTERLLLRGMKVGDCFDMFEYARLPEVTKFLTWSPHPDVEYTKEYLETLSHHYKLGSFYDWAVIYAENDKMIGTCGFTRFNLPNNSAEIGYVINPEYSGRGIAAEAARSVLKFGFEELGLNRIEAKFMVGNDASRKVMEKLGMSYEGVARSAVLAKSSYKDVGCCAILKSEYKSFE